MKKNIDFLSVCPLTHLTNNIYLYRDRHQSSVPYWVTYLEVRMYRLRQIWLLPPLISPQTIVDPGLLVGQLPLLPFYNRDGKYLWFSYSSFL